MYNRRYDKVFLMLRQETAGYGMGQRTPWGSCVMEIKNGGGRLALTVQGLRPLRRGQYTVYALTGEKAETEGFFCGILKPDSNGYGELKWDFNPDGLAGGSRQAEDLHTVAVLTEEGENSSVPMAASFGEKRSWRKDFKRHTEKKAVDTEPKPLAIPKAEVRKVKETVQKAKETVQEVVEEIVQETAEETILVAAEAALAEPETIQEESYHGSFRGLLAKFRQELADLQESGVFQEEDMEEIAKAGEMKQEEKKTDMDVAIEAAEEHERISIQNPLFQGNREMQPFGEAGGIWKCISLEETVLLGDLPIAWQKDCFFLLPLKKYHHLIYRKDGAGYLLGVPGMFTTEDGQKAKEIGFGTYRPMEESEMGYWLWEKK